jgi:hypothetical protein
MGPAKARWAASVCLTSPYRSLGDPGLWGPPDVSFASRSSVATQTTTPTRRTFWRHPSSPASCASCPWPGTTVSPCGWSCWAARSVRPGDQSDQKGCEARGHLPLSRPAAFCGLLPPQLSLPIAVGPGARVGRGLQGWCHRAIAFPPCHPPPGHPSCSCTRGTGYVWDG